MRFSTLARLVMVAFTALVVIGESDAAPGRTRYKKSASKAKVRKPTTPKEMKKLREELEEKGFLIRKEELVTHFDYQYNDLMVEVYLEQREPEDVRINGASMLWYAVDKGLRHAAEYLVRRGADMRAWRHGESLIGRAALSGSKELVEYLHEECRLFLNDPRCLTSWKGAAGIVRRAAQSGNRECIDYVYPFMDELLPRSRNYFSVIDNAGMSGRREIIEYMESKGFPFRKDEILLRAAVCGDIEMIRYLEQRGANLFYVGTAGYTPLMTAALSGNVDCVRYFIDKMGEDNKDFINLATRDGDTALLCAAASGNAAVVSCLITAGADTKATCSLSGDLIDNAAFSGNLQTLSLALSKGSGKSADASRALCMAARFGYLDVVQHLVNISGADVNAVCQIRVPHARPYEDLLGVSGVAEVEETTPLIAAIASGNMEVIDFLVSKQAELTKETKDKEPRLTPLRAAARRGQPDIIRMLIQARACTDLDPGALTQAAENGNLACVRLLVENGWDINAPDPYTKLTPIQAACCRGTDSPDSINWNYDSGSYHTECVSYLLRNGADVTDEFGKKAKSLALHDEVPLFDCAELLWNYGHPLDVEEMRYPLYRAHQIGNHLWVTRLTAGKNARTETDERRSPAFVHAFLTDSEIPYDVKPKWEDARKGYHHKRFVPEMQDRNIHWFFDAHNQCRKSGEVTGEEQEFLIRNSYP